MKSKVTDAIGLDNHAVALGWTDVAPEGAMQFKAGRWGCVVSLLAAVAAKGSVAAFDRQTYGCWGGGVGLGFGNCYDTFPGGMEGFYRFLSDGNEKCEAGKRLGEQVLAWGGERLSRNFLEGERYVKNPEIVRQFVQSLPMRCIPAGYVVAKPLEQIDPEREDIKSVTFFVDPDQLSALVILANYSNPSIENVAVPWAAGCQVIGIFGYRELEREHPRGLVGLTDISARARTRAPLGKDSLSFTAPWPLFLRMEEDVDGSFLQGETWRGLRKHGAEP